MEYKLQNESNSNQHFQALNNSLATFIQGSIESPKSIEEWPELTNGFEPLKCYDIKGCASPDCLMLKSNDYRCWLQVGSMCSEGMKGHHSVHKKTCFECEVFSKISEEPVRALYEKINTIIFHMKNKALTLREFAIKDHLTGLYNRHFFNEIIEREISKIERQKDVVSFIMIDLDGLKQINDNLGHLTGDRILAEVANLLRENVRKADIVFRFGGDEFLIVLVNADCSKTEIMVRRLMDANDRWNTEKAKEYGCRISVSIGCATCTKCSNIHDTLNEADERMYMNKKARLNDVIVLI